MDELQAAMLVVPSEVYYQPKFTYVWTLARQPLSRRPAPPHDSRGGPARDRAQLPRRRRHDASPASWRASPACRGPTPASAIVRWLPRATRRCRRAASTGWRNVPSRRGFHLNSGVIREGCGAQLKLRATNVGAWFRTFVARNFSCAPQPLRQPDSSTPDYGRSPPPTRGTPNSSRGKRSSFRSCAGPGPPSMRVGPGARR